MERCWAHRPVDRPSFAKIVEEFRRGKMSLQGADRNEIVAYCEAMLEDDQTRELRLGATVDSPQQETHIRAMIERTESSGIPEPHCRPLYETLDQSLGKVSPNLTAKGLTLLFDSPLAFDALKLFRKLPRDRELALLLDGAIRKLPTNDPVFDRELVLTACWHGASDLCMLYVNDNPRLAALAIEMVAQSGVDRRLKTAVADRCVQLLPSADDALMCAALRCLVGIGEIKRISLQVLLGRIRTTVPELRNCMLAITARLFADGAKVPKKLLIALIEIAQTTELAIPAIVAACRDVESARVILQNIGNFRPDARVRILLACVPNRELFDHLRPVLDLVPIDDPTLLAVVKARLGDPP
jgi:hypothetical protein